MDTRDWAGKWGLLPLLAAAALAQSSCIGPSASASFDRTLKVQELVRLDINTGSGKIVVRRGAAGAVRIHGEVSAREFMGGRNQRRADEIASNPPIDQTGSMIRLGGRSSEGPFQSVSISYTIDTPADTQVTARTGAGDVEISGLDQPVSLTVGSGRVRVDQIKDSVNIKSGSGEIRVSRIQGSVNFTTGSGAVAFADVQEDVRGGTGSGNVDVDGTKGRVSVKTGSGRIRVTGAAEDVRAGTGSGNIDVRGDPGTDAFWDLGTGSGEVLLTVPSDASFALSARTSSGSFKVDIPISIEEQSRKFLRARVGDGKAHVNVETKSGNIRILRGGAN